MPSWKTRQHNNKLFDVDLSGIRCLVVRLLTLQRSIVAVNSVLRLFDDPLVA